MPIVKYILSYMLLLTMFTVQAQKVGIKGGVNFSNLYEDNLTDENMKLGINAGFYIRNKLGDKVSIQPEFLYSRKGSEIQYDNSGLTGAKGKYRYNMGYLEVPILFVFHINHFNIQIGPYISWLLHVHVKNVDSQGSIQQLEELDRDDFNTIDYGPSAGFGFDFKSGIIGVRYNVGLRKIGEDGIFDSISTKEAKNSTFQLYLGLNL